MNISAIIPAYNEEARIRETIAGVAAYVDEIIVIDDASTDKTADIARQTEAVVFRKEENSGYINAIKKGFQEATGDIVVTIDADGELPAKKIPELVEPILSGKADMVQGKRERIVRPSEKLLTWLASWKGPVGDSGTGFRALSTPMAQKMTLEGRCICGIFALEVLARGGTIEEIPIQLNKIEKPRKIAWYHAGQLWYLLKFMVIPNIN